MIEKMVGETGFEPATLCSQSRQETNKISAFGVNRVENRANRINGLRIGCKPSGLLDDALSDHLRTRFGFPEEPREGFSRLVARGLDSYTYFARGTWVGRVKIGRSNDPSRRVNELYRTPCGEDAELVVVLRGAAFETFYHRLFAQHLYGHEWFEPHPEILAEIEQLTRGPK